MKKIIFSLMTLVLGLSTMNAQDVLGKWKLEDGTAIVEVYKSGDAFNGKIVWLEKPTEPDGSPGCRRSTAPARSYRPPQGCR